MRLSFRFLLIGSAVLTLGCFASLSAWPTIFESFNGWLEQERLLTPPPKAPRPSRGGFFDVQLETAIWQLVNEERQQADLKPFMKDETLTDLARQRAVAISINFTHDGLADLCLKCGENIGWGGNNTTASDAVTAWMQSEAHRENVLFPYPLHVGVGVYRLNDRLYFTLEIKQKL